MWLRCVSIRKVFILELDLGVSQVSIYFMVLYLRTIICETIFNSIDHIFAQSSFIILGII